jgi:hypothetical protein
LSKVTEDLTRKRKIKKKIDGKVVEVLHPIHASKISDSPFILTEEEETHFKNLEGSWDELKNFNDKYSKGVPVVELEAARDIYSKEYKSQMELASKTGTFKSRRMEAFKLLNSVNKTTKEMKEFKLTKKTRDEALVNFPELINDYDAEENDFSELDLVLVNINPRHIDGYRYPEIWNMINGENLLHIYGLKQPSRRRALFLRDKASIMHAEICKMFPTANSLNLEFAEDSANAENEYKE